MLNEFPKPRAASLAGLAALAVVTMLSLPTPCRAAETLARVELTTGESMTIGVAPIDDSTGPRRYRLPPLRRAFNALLKGNGEKAGLLMRRAVGLKVLKFKNPPLFR